jgi:ABC-type transport system involved in multi-copper enzyme maturation permease subunit
MSCPDSKKFINPFYFSGYMRYITYIITTLLYGLAGILGLAGMIYFSRKNEWIVVMICIFILFIALDNFFCGGHLVKTGRKVCPHFVVPPFLMRKKKKR